VKITASDNMQTFTQSRYKESKSVYYHILKLRSATCHMESQSVTRHSILHK